METNKTNMLLDLKQNDWKTTIETWNDEIEIFFEKRQIIYYELY